MSRRDPVRAASVVGCAALSLALLASSRPAPAQAPDDSGWIGKRVITQFGAVITDPRTGKVDDERRSRNLAVAGKDRAVFRIYRVEHADGPWLWLHQENGSARGWVDSRWVIPLDQAIDFYTAQIRANPTAANYIHRANIWKAKGEFDIAIADYNDAIRLEPRDETAYNNRGRARHAKGEFDRAIADFTEAMRLDPNYSVAYLNRGVAWTDKKEYAKAIGDFDEAIRLDPGYPRPYFGRAVVSLLTGRDAEADARAAIERDGWRGGLATYAALIGHFAARRIEHDDAARRWLGDAARESSKDDWPYPVVRFLRKEIDEPALLALATDDEKRTEARCFLGLDRLLAGRAEPAREHFRWAREHGDPRSTESTIAVAELDRLEAKPTP